MIMIVFQVELITSEVIPNEVMVSEVIASYIILSNMRSNLETNFMLTSNFPHLIGMEGIKNGVISSELSSKLSNSKVSNF